MSNHNKNGHGQLNSLKFPLSMGVDKGSADYYRIPYTIQNGKALVRFEDLTSLISLVRCLDLNYSAALCGSGSIACFLSDVSDINKDLEEECRSHPTYHDEFI